MDRSFEAVVRWEMTVGKQVKEESKIERKELGVAWGNKKGVEENI